MGTSHEFEPNNTIQGWDLKKKRLSINLLQIVPMKLKQNYLVFPNNLRMDLIIPTYFLWVDFFLKSGTKLESTFLQIHKILKQIMYKVGL